MVDPKRSERHARLQAEMMAVRARYEAGESTPALAREYGVSPTTVARYVGLAGGRVRTLRESNGANVRRLTAAMRRFSDEEEADIGLRYLAGETLDQIGQDLGVNQQLVARSLNRRGIARRHKHPGRRCGHGKLQGRGAEALALYAAGVSGEEIADVFGVAAVSVYRLLRQSGGTVRGPSESKKGRPVCRARRYALDEGAFDQVTPGSAYWVGFLMADGCVSDDDAGQPSVILGLKKSDRGHVKAFKRFLGSGHAISEHKAGPGCFPGGEGSCKLSVRSGRLALALARYGILPRKSLTATPSGLTGNRDFWRGMVDGDGYVLTRNYTLDRPYPGVGLVGSRATVAAFAAFVRGVDPSCRANPRRVGSIWDFRTTGRHALLVLRTLYAGAQTTLGWKADLAAEALRWRPRGGTP